MESPIAVLVEQTIGLDARLVQAAGAGDPASLREVLEGLDDTALIEVVQRTGAIANLSDAVGSAAAGVFADRSQRGDENSIARRLGERNAPTAVAALAH